MPPVAFPTPSLTPTAYERAREQATELEGVFLNTLMKEMFASLGTDEKVMGGGFAEETWRGMQAEQFADAMARAGGIGLADAIVADLLALQGGASTYPAPPKAGAYQ
jgi:peptidoglycan hydrolase FlgJ